MIRDGVININKNGHLVYWGLMGLFFLLVILRNLLLLPIPVAVYLVIPVLIGIKCTKTEIVAFAISCLPLGSTFQYKLALLFLLVIVFFRFGSSRKINRYVIPIVLMGVWELLHAIVDVQFGVYEFFRSFAELLFILLLIADSQKNYDYSFVIDSLLICTTFICIVILLSLMRSGSIYDILSSKYRFGVASEDLEYGANISDNRLGTICNISILCLLQRQQLKGNSLRDTILLFVLIFFGLLTKSRTFLMCLALNLLYFFTIPSTMKKSRKYSLVVLVVLISVWLLFQNRLSEVLGSFADRFKTTDITSGRNALMILYHDLIVSNSRVSLFGLGLQNLSDKLRSISIAYINVPHNGIQEVLIIWGIPGLIIVVSFVLSLLNSAKTVNKSIKRINLFPLFFVIIVIQAGQFIRSEIIMLIMSIVYLSLLTDFGERKIIDDTCCRSRQ